MMIRLFTIFCFLGLAGCAGNGIVVIGNASVPVPVDEVKLYYSAIPDCDFEVVAIIQAPGDYTSPASLLKALRKRAAALGANAVHVHYLQRVGASSYLGQARALKCVTLQPIDSIRPGFEAMI